MLSLLVLASLLLFNIAILRLFRPLNLTEVALTGYVASAAHIVVIGMVLSTLGQLGELPSWNAASWILTACIMVSALTSGPLRRRLRTPMHLATGLRDRLFRTFRETDSLARVLLLGLSLTAAGLCILNLSLILRFPPHNWDSMSYHLPRMAYYLQQNSLVSFDANYWAQVIHPKNATLLLIFTYLLSGSRENLTQIVQYASYLTAIAAAYGIGRRIDLPPHQALTGALIFALLPVSVLEATTTQNDMILTALFGATAYFLLAWRGKPRGSSLVIAGSAFGLALGTKESFLMAIPPIALIMTGALLSQRNSRSARLRAMATLTLAICVSVGVFALPSGYFDNLKRFGNLFGPESVRREHSFHGTPTIEALSEGSMNVLRYGFDFLSLDGLPPVRAVQYAQTALRAGPIAIVRAAGINLETSEETRTEFWLDKMPVASEDHSFWGPLGFGLVWLSIVLALAGITGNRWARLLAACTVVYLIGQAYVGPYDAWRGRYFLLIALLAAPVAGASISARSPVIRTYVAAILVLGSISSITSVLFKSQQPLIAVTHPAMLAPSFFELDRIEQLTVNHPVYTAPIRKFNSMVPSRANVAISLKKNSYEYPLFGEGLTRTIIPINSFAHGLQPIPRAADFLLFDSTFTPHQPGDVHLGVDWYLRDLRPVAALSTHGADRTAPDSLTPARRKR